MCPYAAMPLATGIRWSTKKTLHQKGLHMGHCRPADPAQTNGCPSADPKSDILIGNSVEIHVGLACAVGGPCAHQQLSGTAISCRLAQRWKFDHASRWKSANATGPFGSLLWLLRAKHSFGQLCLRSKHSQPSARHGCILLAPTTMALRQSDPPRQAWASNVLCQTLARSAAAAGACSWGRWRQTAGSEQQHRGPCCRCEPCKCSYCTTWHFLRADVGESNIPSPCHDAWHRLHALPRPSLLCEHSLQRARTWLPREAQASFQASLLFKLLFKLLIAALKILFKQLLDLGQNVFGVRCCLGTEDNLLQSKMLHQEPKATIRSTKKG